MGGRDEAVTSADGERSVPRQPWRTVDLATQAVSRALVALLLMLITLYQRGISSWTRPCCRFVPSCSAYAVECLKKYGLLRGSAKSLWRLLRCHPLCKGGLDQP